MVDNIRVPLIFGEIASGGQPNIRTSLTFAEPLTGGQPNVRASLVLAEPMTGGNPNVRSSLVFAEPMTGGNPNVRLALIIVESLIPVPEELPVATAVFPTLRGRAWDCTKNPELNVVRRRATTGRRTANAFMPYPVWHFELVYEFLRDDNDAGAGYSDMQTLVGLFMQMQSTGESFLYHDKDDFRVVGGTIATADGVTLQWPFFRSFGGFLEPVGQIDLSTLATFASTAVNTSTNAINVPLHGLTTAQGPVWVKNSGGALPAGLVAATAYWVIAVDVDHFKLASSKANALANTPVALTAQGSGTDTLTKGVAVYDNGALQGPTAWTLTLPNQLVFASAPASGHTITADFDFWFVCDFSDNTLTAKQFASKLWDLGKLDFESVIQ